MKRRSRPLSAPQKRHIDRVHATADYTIHESRKARDEMQQGKCPVAAKHIIEAASYEGSLRAHYSSLPEERRGYGTEAKQVASKAEDFAAEVRSEFMKRCMVHRGS